MKQLHRRLLYDDNFGVVEPLDETAFGEGLVVRGKHTVQLNSITWAAEPYRFKAAESAYGPISLLAKTNFKLEEWTNKFNKNVSILHRNKLNANLTVPIKWSKIRNSRYFLKIY